MPPTNEFNPDERRLPAKSDKETKRLEVALVPGTDHLPTTDLQALLGRRLWFVAFLATVGTGIALSFAFVAPPLPLHIAVVFATAFVTSAAITGVLWKNASLSVRQLRTIELLLFATAFGYWGFCHADFYPYFRLPSPPIWFGSIMAHAISLPWVIIIFLYGMFIPNTWRRCAAVVGAAAVIPLVISYSTGISDSATAGHNPRNFWIPMGMWMSMAAAIAIYGAHRIEVLRVEASNARKLGQYRLKERLGSGGMGEVYLAEHLLLRRPCAVKLIRPDRTTESHSLLRFEREVQATANLTHPNTVQVFDYGHAEDGTFYYAMEYLPGLNLEELVKRHGPLPAERAIHLLRQVLGALHEAHAAGLIHRDLKPSNIISCRRGGLHDVAKLLDFGLVRSCGNSGGADHLTLEGAVAGTPAFMSPEQADGKHDLDARSDIYSLGAVAYFLLTAQPPFVRPSHLQTLIAHMSDPVTPLSQLQADVPADIEVVILRCLEKDPARRWPDARSMDRALAGCEAAGLWTEERAAAWLQSQGATVYAPNSEAEATTKGG
jgi:serine/threonine-protein kinase